MEQKKCEKKYTGGLGKKEASVRWNAATCCIN